MNRHYSITLLSLFAFFGFAGQSALAAPKASPKAFAGVYTISGFSTSLTTVQRGYNGKIKISSSGKVSGIIKKTETTFGGDGQSKQKSSRVKVTGKISKVKKASHAGYKILEASTNLKFSDGSSGVLAIMYPYTVKLKQISGYGPMKDGPVTTDISVQKQ